MSIVGGGIVGLHAADLFSCGSEKTVAVQTPRLIFCESFLPMTESNQTSVARDLVVKAQAGDLEAFESLVSLYEKRIYSIAFRMVENPQDAEDILQETFLKAYENLAQFRHESGFYTWIVQIAVNAALLKLKKSSRMQSVSLDEPLDGEEDFRPREIAVWEETPESLYSSQEVKEILEKNISSLPLIYRSVFLLADVEELPVQKVAEMLELSLPAAKSRLIRARLELRERLNGYFRKKGAPVYSAEHVH
jgi:RNA polymerase sigma-70 factor (ECF subfamily)